MITPNNVYLGDSLELIKQIPDSSIDLIFCDPPFGHNNNNGDLIQRREVALGLLPNAGSSPRPIANDGAEANEVFRAILPEFKRVLVPGGCCCCCCCGGGGPDPQFARWSLWAALGIDRHVGMTPERRSMLADVYSGRHGAFGDVEDWLRELGV